MGVYYRPIGQECVLFEAAWRRGLPLLLKGPTGAGKSRMVEYMAERLGRPLVTVACHDETSAVDLVGRHVLRGDSTEWQDGPVTRAVREGAILYLDEIAEARPDVVVVLHPLSDHRRRLFVERRDEVVAAAPGFGLVVSYNPGYQRGLKELKTSTRQRFVALRFDYPEAAVEAEVLVGETGAPPELARRLVSLAGRIRSVGELGLGDPPSTRLLVDAAQLIAAGVPPRLACRAAIVEPLADDPEVATALAELVALVF